MEHIELHAAVATEIEALHADLALWLSGRCEQDGAWFAHAFEQRFHHEFFNVQPAGIVLSRKDLIDDLGAGHGVSPAFDIRIRNVVLRQELNNSGQVLATYEEYQRGAKNSRSDNARLSTVLFDVGGDGRLVWRAIHETWLPEENHAAENFVF